MNKVCKFCSSEFETNRRFQVYCSKKCSKENWNIESRKIHEEKRFTILRRDEFRCIYCGLSSIEDAKLLQIDHIIPRSRGGEDTAVNLVTSCEPCNQEKLNEPLPTEVIDRIRDVVKMRNSYCGIKDDRIIKL